MKSNRQEKIINDTVKHNYDIELQRTVDLFLKKGIFSFDKEYYYTGNLLDNKKNAEVFAKNLVIAKYPEIINLPYEFEISEDNSKKLWFVYMRVPKTLDGGIFMIIVKNNCKVLFFSNFCCPR